VSTKIKFGTLTYLLADPHGGNQAVRDVGFASGGIAGSGLSNKHVASLSDLGDGVNGLPAFHGTTFLIFRIDMLKLLTFLF
jgi:hypothetical protein